MVTQVEPTVGVLWHSAFPRSVSVFEEGPAAAGASAFEPACERGERRGLWQAEDRPERQRSPVGVVAVRDPAGRVAEDLDRRFWHVLVVVGRACLPQVL